MKKPTFKIRLKVGDVVQVRSGASKFKDEKGVYKTGRIVAVHPRENKVTIEGVNVVKKHIKRSKQNPQGGIVEINKPLHASRVGIYDPSTNKPSRIGYKIDKKGQKRRVYKASGKEIDK